MTYSQGQFAQDLKQEIQKDFNIQRIAQWAYMLSIDRSRDICPDLDKIIQTVAVMNEGPEFQFSEDKLTLFANQLEK